MHPRITRALAVGDFRLALDFADGSRGVVDLAPLISGRGGVFQPLQDPAFFSRVAVDLDAGTVIWPNGVDLDPDVLYEAAQTVPAGSTP
jgi:hypothetical protein